MLSAGQELAEVAQAEPERVRSKQQQTSRMTCKNEHCAEAPPRTRCKNVELGYPRQRETLVRGSTVKETPAMKANSSSV